VSLRARLVAAFGYVLVLVIVALLVPLALNLSRRVDAEVRSEARGQAQLLAAFLSGRLDERAQLERLVANSARDLGGRVIVVGRRGRLLADSEGSELESTSYASRPEIADALRGRPTQGERHSDSLGVDLLFTAVPVVSRGRPEGAVRVTQSVDAVQSEVRSDVLALVGVAAVVLLLGLGLAWMLAGTLARPLRRLAATARGVAGGELDAQARVEGSSEQREVASAFNDMTGRLARALRSQREFVANASHQLRTPLTGLRLRLEAASLKAKDPEVERELLAAERETVRLARLLTELLTLARERERPEPEDVSLAEVAVAAHERWEGPAQTGGRRLLVRGEGDPVVAATAADLAVVLDNLVENALNYSATGTVVAIEWGADAGAARLVVLDEGPGIAPAERERVFERFFRGEASRGGAPGTGLGLSVVEALAARWDGTARLVDRPEGGTQAEVVLPLAAPGSAGAGQPSADPQLDDALPERS
jgi:two-component system, OmpR family, sensor kinase